jgi:hypothetical protein
MLNDHNDEAISHRDLSDSVRSLSPFISFGVLLNLRSFMQTLLLYRLWMYKVSAILIPVSFQPSYAVLINQRRALI